MKIDYSIFNQKTSIDRFIFAIENAYYVEGHELLEDDWRELKKQGQTQKALVLKGLINGSTALALYYVKNKPHGFEKVWKAFEKYTPLLDKVDFEEKNKYIFAKKKLIELKNKIDCN